MLLFKKYFKIPLFLIFAVLYTNAYDRIFWNVFCTNASNLTTKYYFCIENTSCKNTFL